MTDHIKTHRDGFAHGMTHVTKAETHETGIGFAVLKLAPGESHAETLAAETAFLLMDGSGTIGMGDAVVSYRRHSLFDEMPCCVHAPAGTRIEIKARDATEFTLYSVLNTAFFAPRLFTPDDLAEEHRGEGQVGDTCHRLVRTIFDRTNSDPHAQLVLGEVVTLPGRWSSYPPHHHPQPEIYHYRFTAPQGYGHAELGDAVLKVQENDTVCIRDGLDHPQCAAPGYGMYYAWVIRHLPENPYTVPEFTPEHRWIMAPDAPYWHPSTRR